MKRVERLRSPDGTLSVTLSFECETIMVQNPTRYALAIRTGGLDVPNELDDADIYVAAGGMLVYPVIGREFAMGFTEPSLDFIPSGMPTTAVVTFLAGEPAPQFGAIATVDASVRNTVETNATITNSTLSVEQSGTWNVNANITDSTIAVTQSGTWNVNANITDSSIAVTQSGTWTMSANITNSSLTINPSAGSQFNIDIQESSIILPIYEGEDLVLFRGYGGSSTTRKTYNISLPDDVRAVSIILDNPYIDYLQVRGNPSGIEYFAFTDARDYFSAIDVMTAPIFTSLDTTLILEYEPTIATPSEIIRVMGHRTLPGGTTTQEGALLTREVWLEVYHGSNADYDAVLAAGSGLSTRFTYDTSSQNFNERSFLKSVYISSDRTNNDNQVRGIVDVLNNSNSIVHRIVDWRSYGGVGRFTDTFIDCGNLQLPKGYKVRFQAQNSDTSSRRITCFCYIEEVAR